MHDLLVAEYQPDMIVKAEAKQQKEAKKAEEEAKKAAEEEVETLKVSAPKIEFKVVDKLELDKQEVVATPQKDESANVKTDNTEFEQKVEKPKVENPKKTEEQNDKVPAVPTVIRAKAGKLDGPKIVEGQKIDLAQFDLKRKPVASSSNEDTKKKRKRITKKVDPRKAARKIELKKSKKQSYLQKKFKKQVRENLAKLQGGGKNKGAKLRREKRQARKEQEELDMLQQEEAEKTIKVTEFVTTAELAQMMDVAPTQIISACFTLGMMVTQNQRLDAETLTIVAEEFGFAENL